MATYAVLKNILHGDGARAPKLYRRGDTLDLAPEDAKPLIATGSLALPAEK